MQKKFTLSVLNIIQPKKLYIISPKYYTTRKKHLTIGKLSLHVRCFKFNSLKIIIKILAQYFLTKTRFSRNLWNF